MSRRMTMLLGPDLVVGLCVAIVLVSILPSYISLSVARDVFSMGATLLSIVFSVFVAALAIIIASPDDKFIQFLEAEGLFADILWGFKVTLIALFLALSISVGAYVLADFQLASHGTSQHRSGVIVVLSAIGYSLTATLTSALAAMRHAGARVEFLRASGESARR